MTPLEFQIIMAAALVVLVGAALVNHKMAYIEEF